MRLTGYEIRGAPLTQVVPRLVFALLLAALCGPLCADDSTDWLKRAETALKTGDNQAIAHAARALEAEPLGAPENRQMALAMFWAGHFDDSARYMRRALTADPNALMDQPALSDAMPGETAVERLNALAEETEDDPELCFLTGALLMINRDRPRALAFLVRAAELAGTDGQAEKLIGEDESDRNELRGGLALKEGDYVDAVRSFTFAALDSPRMAEYYAGLAIALACSGDLDLARTFAARVYAHYHHGALFPWLHELDTRGGDLASVARQLESSDTATLEDYKLATLLYVAGGHWHSAREAGVQGLLIDKLDEFIHDARIWMDESDLKGDPDDDTPAPDETQDDPAEDQADTPRTIEQARKHIRTAEFTRALKILDTFVTDDAEPEVYHLVFVCAVGRGELTDAGAALQLWFSKVDDDERMRLNAVRELFAREELFQQWREQILVVRDADPNVGLPRLLNSYVEVTRGRYNSARDELVVAKIEAPGNRLVVALDTLLSKEEYQRDTTPRGIPNDPSPKALFGRGERLFREGRYEEAKGAYLQALERDREIPFIAAGLFRCYFALGDYDNAYLQLEAMLKEQNIAERDASVFRLLLETGYDNKQPLKGHISALKEECAERPLSWKPWLVYGIVLLEQKDYGSALDALQTWYDNVTGQRDPVLEKFYDLAKQRAS